MPIFFKYRKKGFLLCLVIRQNPISQVIKLDVKEGANKSLLIWETMRDVVGGEFNSHFKASLIGPFNQEFVHVCQVQNIKTMSINL